MLSFIAVVVILLSTVLAYSALTYLFYWYEAWRDPGLSEVERLAGGPPGRLAIGCVVRDVWYYTALGLLRIIWPLHRVLARKQGRGPLIVLVHGLNNAPACWLPLRRRLARRGLPNTHTVHYPSSFGTLDEAGERLGARVGELAAKHPGRPVVLVCHSMGGLVAKAWLGRPADPGAVAGIITLGTPHAGSRLAALGWTCLARSLYPGCPEMDRLREATMPAAIRRLALATPLDNMVLPIGNARPGERWDFAWTAPMSHTAMVFRADVAEQVGKTIEEWLGPDIASGGEDR
jgi:pimeloyl-ACP methyl ester carboxylesterase